jgi:hypothetical protein
MHSPQNLSKFSQQQLKNLAESLDVFLFKQSSPGEKFHKQYQKDPAVFHKIIKNEVSFTRDLKQFFASQFTRLSSLVFLQLVKADDTSSYFNNAAWNEENGTLTAIIDINLGNMFDVGAFATANELHIHTNLDQYNARQERIIRNYSLKLAKGINNTTKDRIKEQLKTSLQLNENRQQLTDRIDNVINNPVRAQMIAQTESIRAFTTARLETAKRIGGYKKVWLTHGANDNLCTEPEAEGAIEIDTPFIGGYDGPPAHPNCRCYIRLVYDNQAASSNDLSDLAI